MNFNIHIIHIDYWFIRFIGQFFYNNRYGCSYSRRYWRNFEDNGENDSSGAQEKNSSNLVVPGPNLDNVFQIFQNPQVIGFLGGMMTHQAHKIYKMYFPL